MPARTTRATHPMSKAATKAADDAFYAQHPEMVDAGGRRKSIDPHSAKCKQLRRQWMNLYAQHGGQVKKSRAKDLAKDVQQAKKDIQQDYPPSVGVTDAVVACPSAAGGNHSVNVEKVLSSPFPGVPKDAVPICNLNQTTLQCSHNGRTAKNGVLYVVPTSYVHLGDSIQCTATVSAPCGSHPEWQIGGMWTSTEHGAKTSFSAKVYKASLLEGWLGLEKIEPQCYRVAVSACNGGGATTEVLAYPPDKWGGKINIQQIVDFWDTVIDHLPADEEEKKTWKKGWFKGAIEYEQQWQEETSSHLAFCESKVAGKFEPLWGFESIEFPIWPATLVPPLLSVHLKAGFYLQITGGVSLSVSFKGKHYPTEKPDVRSKLEVELYGLVKLEVSLKLELVSSKLIAAKAAGEMGVKAGATAKDEEGWGVDFFAQFTGLEVSFTLTACFNIIEVPTRKYPIIGESGKYTVPWKFAG